VISALLLVAAVDLPSLPCFFSSFITCERHQRTAPFIKYGKGVNTETPDAEAGSLSFCEFAVSFSFQSVFLPSRPGLFYSLCFCGMFLLPEICLCFHVICLRSPWALRPTCLHSHLQFCKVQAWVMLEARRAWRRPMC
jgi:hypothetical protein